MPDLWMPGAERLDIGDHAPTDGGPAKAIMHITWDRNASAARPADLVSFAALRSYFSGSGRAVAPHVLWDPWTGRVVQFVPANSRSKSLVDTAGGTRTNRAGSVVIQIEALFFPYCRTPDGRVYPRLVDTPCKGWDELHAWVKSWGVPDICPNGRPENCTRDEHTWETRAGWYPHAAVPENNHQDPLSWPDFPKTQEEDMTPEQAKQLKELHDKLLPFMGWDYKGTGKQDAWALLNTATAQIGALTATVSKLAAGGGLNAAEIQSAAEAGAKAALEQLGHQLTS
ncbi:peptidoglycan-binding protein [Streptomyces sp. NPDC058960]|uniref:peptidoglycan-binding protein n=1 Tax=Streptomyces sp. NPDC058960 TaxID=3346679 RepID=UPI0036AD8CD5